MPHSTQQAVRRLLHPESIALIGASGDEAAISGLPLGILQRHGYSGQIYIVNPNRSTVGGFPPIPGVDAIPGQIDLALISRPGQAGSRDHRGVRPQRGSGRVRPDVRV